MTMEMTIHHVTEIKQKSKWENNALGKYKITYLTITQKDGTKLEITNFIENNHGF